ncbi:tetratricopeptide repeat protein, partial [archaeon]
MHLPDRPHQASQESKGDEEAEEGGQDGSALRMAVIIKELMCLFALRVETYKLAGKKQIAQDYQQKMMELPIVYQQYLSETQSAKVLDNQMTENAVLGQALELLHNQAKIIQSCGQYQEALAIHQDVLRKRLELFKEGSLVQLDIANSYLDVGVCQYKLHQYYLALVSLERAMNIRKLLVGEMHADVAKVMVEMGHVFTLLQYRPNAVFMYERSLDIYKHIDAQSEETRKTWGLLAQSYVYVGRYEDALYAYNQAIVVYKKTQGHDCHADIVTYLNSMASIVGAQGKLIEVIYLAEHSEQIIRMLHLQQQPVSPNEEMKCVFSLARAYFELEHYRTANKYFKRYMVVYSACMKSHYVSPLHPKIISTINFLDGMFRDYKMEKRYINDVSMLVLMEQNSMLFNPQGVQAEDGLILFYPFLPKAQQEIMQHNCPFLKITYSLQVVINVLKTCADYLFGREKHHIVRHDNMVNRFARKKILEKELQKHLTNMISEDKVTLRAIIKTCEACKFNLTPGQYSDLATISISKILYIIEMEEIYQTDTRFAREGKLAMQMPHWSEDTKQLYVKRLREFHLFAHMRSYD